MAGSSLHLEEGRYSLLPSIEPGAPPATLTAPPDSTPTKIHLMAYGPETVFEKPLAALEDLDALPEGADVVWIQVMGLGDVETIRRLGERFDLDVMLLEDVLRPGQRSKLDEAKDFLFLVLQSAENRGWLDIRQFSLFFNKKTVITFQERVDGLLDRLKERIRKGQGRIRKGGGDYLAYGLVDSVVDHYFPLLDDYGDALEKMEDEVLVDPDHEIVSGIHHINRDLIRLRHALLPQREALNLLIDEYDGFLDPGLVPFFKDCHDHVMQAVDLISTYRELALSLSDIYLSSISNRMNEVMKVLTLIATIFIPLTFICGLYGMNFNPQSSPFNMPELNWYWGYPVILGVMALVALVMLLYFRKRKWL